jgi:Zn-dependent membrane protease YugP
MKDFVQSILGWGIALVLILLDMILKLQWVYTLGAIILCLGVFAAVHYCLYGTFKDLNSEKDLW